MANAGQRKLKKWRRDRSLRQAAKDLGVDYRSYYRWEVEGGSPEYDRRKLCLEVAGVPLDDWERK